MDLSISSTLSKSSPSLSLSPSPFHLGSSILNPFFPNFNFDSSNFQIKPLFSRQNPPIRAHAPNQNDNDGFVLEDVPHLTDFLPDLPSYQNPLHKSPAYAIVKQTLVTPKDVVAQKIVVQKDSPRVHTFSVLGHERGYISSKKRFVLA